jgi:hypothetical protein
MHGSGDHFYPSRTIASRDRRRHRAVAGLILSMSSTWQATLRAFGDTRRAFFCAAAADRDLPGHLVSHDTRGCGTAHVCPTGLVKSAGRRPGASAEIVERSAAVTVLSSADFKPHGVLDEPTLADEHLCLLLAP